MADFDVEGYANNFQGHGKINRLIFVAQHSAGEIQNEAFRLAIGELVSASDTSLYASTIQAAHEANRCLDIQLNEAYVDAKTKEMAAKEAALEADLKAHKANVITDSIRLSFQDLGQLHYEMGHLHDALKNFARSKDFCTQSNHVLTCCLNCIQVSLEMRNIQSVINYATKAEQGCDLKNAAKQAARLDAAWGLGYMEMKMYYKAGLKFTKVAGGASLGWPEVIAPQEIALFGVLCGLAQFSRSELRTHIIDNVNFRESLETFPQARELVNDFYHSRYAQCFANLHKLEFRLHVDLWLSQHAKALCTMVRDKALVQYTSPYSSVSLVKMAAAFSTEYRDLEKDVVRLIQKNQIPARIDSGSQVLYKTKANVQAQAYKDALSTGEEYLTQTRALLLRAQILRYGLVSPQGGSKGGRKGKTGALGSSLFANEPLDLLDDPAVILEDDEEDEDLHLSAGPSLDLEDSMMADRSGSVDAESLRQVTNLIDRTMG